MFPLEYAMINDYVNRYLGQLFKKSVNILFLVSAFAIPLWPKVSVKLIIATLIVAIIANSKLFSIRRFLDRSWDLLLYLLVLLLGLLWTENLGTGLRVLETSFTLLAMPLLFSFVYNRDGKILRDIISCFIYGVVTASVICVTAAFLHVIKTGSFDKFFYYQFTGIIDSHPTYHAYFVIFSITILLFQLYNGRTVKTSWLVVFITIFLFITLIFTSGKTSYAGLLVIFSYFLLRSILEEMNSYRWLVLGLIAIMIFVIFMVHTSNYFADFVKEGDYWERFSLWKAAIHANTNWLLGVGTGDYKVVLNAYYKLHGMENYASGNYNSHNQFIQIYFVHGLLGLVAILIVILRPIYLAVKNRQVLGVLLFFPFIIYGFNEVFLDRYQGVVFLAFVHQLIISDGAVDKMTSSNLASGGSSLI